MEKKLKFYETASFLRRQKAWYKRLKNSGFEDLERLIGGKFYCQPATPNNYRRKKTEVTRDARVSYYIFIGQCLHQEDFKCERDRLILSWHADGIMIARIVEHLNEMGIRCHRQTVRFTIRKFEKKWKIRDWHAKQLTSNRHIA